MSLIVFLKRVAQRRAPRDCWLKAHGGVARMPPPAVGTKERDEYNRKRNLKRRSSQRLPR